MLLQKEHDPIVSGGLGTGGEFRIANSPKAFEILSANLYQDRPLAIIREISCNAADAHKSVGKPLTDIQVHLPTYGEPFFSVRDYGPGLSQADVLDLYTTYFKSAKDNSNDFIGGFGLGSKSPFSMVDQFTVTSWHGGFKTNYVMYKDAGLPRVNVTGSVPSNEPSGLEVRLAVSGNHSDWLTKAQQFFSWWPALPKITGVANGSIKSMVHPDNILVQSDNKIDGYPEWALYKNIAYNAKCIAFMGLVPYTLQIGAITGLSTDLATFMRDRQIVLAFPVGALSINPSRETLTYDKDTCATLIRRLTELHKTFFKKAEDAVANAKTMYQARKIVYGKGGLSSAYHHTILQSLRWNGKPIESSVYLDATGPKRKFAVDVSVGCYTYRTHYSKAWRKQGIDGTISHYLSSYQSGDNITYLWFPNITAKTYRTVEHNYDSVVKAAQRGHTFVIIGGSTYADVCQVMEEAGFPTPEDGSALAEPPKAPKSVTKSVVTKGYVFSNTLSYDKTDVDVDLKGGGLYVSFFDGDPEHNLDPLRFAAKFGVIDPKATRIVGFRKAKLATQKFQKELASNGWIEYNPNWFQAIIKPEDIRKQVKYNTFYATTFPVLPQHITTITDKYESLNKQQPNWPMVQDFLAAYQELKTLDTIQSFYFVTTWFSKAQADAAAQGERDGKVLSLHYQNFLNAHPMLQYCFSYGPNPTYGHLVEYFSR